MKLAAMKAAAAGIAVALLSLPALADVGVSINVGEPGFYGQIDLGGAPPPQLVYAQPQIIEQVPVGVAPEPIYLHVPPGYARHWRSHCHEYNACGRPVYFVRDTWYRTVYVPHYREHHGHPMEHREIRHEVRHEVRHDEHHGDHHDRGHDEHHGDHDHH
jgi:hypothetical protein